MVGPELVIRAEFRRGFVAHVTCPLSAWLGGPCERCRVPHVGVSRGLVIRSHSGGSEFAVADCPDCRGTGSVGGVAAAVCGSQPVERVTISDKEPEEHQPPGETPPNYSWYSQGFPDDRATLPLVLFDRLTDWMPCLTDGTMRRAYPTRRAALDALSAAALAVGREWAGLTRP